MEDNRGMKEYYAMIVECCMSRCCTFEDLGDKRKRRLHNKAMDRLAKIEREMYIQSDRSSGLVLELLKHSDERVQLFAGAYCIHAQVHAEEGVQILSQIRDCSSSKYMRVSAGQNIDYCVPFGNSD